MSEYERTREKRIKENLERMQKLGILDLSLQFKAASTSPKPARKKSSNGGGSRSPPVRSSGPSRRSSRLQNGTPIDYSEVRAANITWGNEDLFGEEFPKLEVYSEEYKKRLGYTERFWTLFVDGYGKDGRRIYDPINGKTCHQCRQKTLGHRTHCSRCNKVQGQFCGDCLYMRYGEHVLEANENPNWVCPVCRGICNCSICRNAKGLAPTGQVYRKAAQLGFKSVAHYLVEEHCPNSSVEKDSGIKNQSSARRSLPFSDADAPKLGEDIIHPSIEGNGDHDKVSMKNEVEDPAADESSKKIEEKKGVKEGDNEKEVLMENGGGAVETKLDVVKDLVAATPKPNKKQKRKGSDPDPDSIAGRLRERRGKQT